MTVRGRSRCATNRRIRQSSLTGGIEIKLPRIRRVEIRIVGIGDQRLLVRRECSAEHRLVNPANPELRRMPPGGVARIVAELIFLLLPEYGKRSDWRGKLVIAERLKSRDGVKRCAERKCQREAIVRIPRFGMVQPARIEVNEPSHAGLNVNWFPITRFR